MILKVYFKACLRALFDVSHALGQVSYHQTANEAPSEVSVQGFLPTRGRR